MVARINKHCLLDLITPQPDDRYKDDVNLLPEGTGHRGNHQFSEACFCSNAHVRVVKKYTQSDAGTEMGDPPVVGGVVGDDLAFFVQDVDVV